MRHILLTLLLGLSATSAWALDLSREEPSANIEKGIRPLYIVDKTCVISTEDEFRINVSDVNPVIYKASDAAVKAILEYVNGERAKNDLFALEATKILMGLFADDGGLFAGVAMFDENGCLVPGSVSVVPLTAWVDFIASIGLTPEDFSLDPGVEEMAPSQGA